ncbi:MAG: C4-dicarboxylate TRAP transporter substrate-binding protein [Treponema sp.]|jgi:tripartite ATP-independent transporter DctP family solute receptor|nr:C4-dicarboxylate TRAP transporter substrate-binding protein [Treponema sp.]
MIKRKLLIVLTALIAAGTLFAGGSKDPAGQSTAVKPVVIQIGYENNPGEPVDLGIHRWAELVEQRSKGTMKIEIFPSSQLGNKNALIDQMLAGMNVITLADGAFYADRGVPDLGICFAPYLFGSWDEAWQLIKSDWWKGQMGLLEQKGLKILTANWIYGERHTITKRPVREVSNFAGLKIRVPNNVIQVKGMEIMGATPTPMPLGEVYTALQQGVIDGMENPLTTIYGNKTQEVAKYLTLDGHVKNFTTWVCGTQFFNSLTAEQQQILVDCGNEAGIYNNQLQNQQSEETLTKLKAEGVEVITVDIGAFQEQAKGFYDIPEIKAMFSPGLYDTVSNAKAVN